MFVPNDSFRVSVRLAVSSDSFSSESGFPGRSPYRLVTTAAIEPGTLIWHQNDASTQTPFFQSLQSPFSSSSLSSWIALDHGVALFLSHSCQPNTRIAGHGIIVSRCFIPPDTPLTLDIACWRYRFPLPIHCLSPCDCAAPECRRNISHQDWKLDSVQLALGNSFIWGILNQIEAQEAEKFASNTVLIPCEPYDDRGLIPLTSQSKGRGKYFTLHRGIERKKSEKEGFGLFSRVGLKCGTVIWQENEAYDLANLMRWFTKQQIQELDQTNASSAHSSSSSSASASSSSSSQYAHYAQYYFEQDANDPTHRYRGPIDLSLIDRDCANFWNHSCQPNCAFVPGNSNEIATIRDIQPGEELVYDYGTAKALFNGEFHCGCGASKCRRIVTDQDWGNGLWRQFGPQSCVEMRSEQRDQALRQLNAECLARSGGPARRRKVALLTYDGIEQYAAAADIPDWDDRSALLPAFSEFGLDCDSLIWNAYTPSKQPNYPWKAHYSAVIIRSTWDYTDSSKKYSEFMTFLRDLQLNQGILLENCIEIAIPNANKLYLKELHEQAGIPLLPTLFVQRFDTENVNPSGNTAFLHRIQAMIEADSRFSGSNQFVLKPCISAGAKNTQRFTYSASSGQTHTQSGNDDAELDVSVYSPGEWLILQPLAREIPEYGELSFLYFGGEYQYSARKRVQPGDFRVQEQYGGRTEYFNAPEWMIRQSRQILYRSVGHLMGRRGAELDQWSEEQERSGSPQLPLYARVDAVNRGGQLLLMELEMLEPSLYWACLPPAVKQQAAQNFARCLLNKMINAGA